MPPRPLLVARDLTRRTHDGRTLIDVPQFVLQAGECLALVGPTGSGKTLVLRSLAQLDPLDGGTVELSEQAVTDHGIPAFRATVQYVAQRPALAGGSVEANLRLPFELAVHAHRNFDAALAINLFRHWGQSERLLDRRSRDLSGGERQLVALVRSLLTDPQVLLLDEPTAALDPSTTRLVESSLSEWRQQSSETRAVVWVSHDPAQVARVSTRVCHMEGGRLRAEDAP